MRIVEIDIENYKCFLSAKGIQLGPGFNVVVGPNNTGKTALLEALSLQLSYRPHRSLTTLPRVATPPNPTSRVTFTIAVSGNEIRDALFTRANFQLPVPEGEAPNQDGGSQYLQNLLQKDRLDLQLGHEARQGNSSNHIRTAFPTIRGMRTRGDSLFFNFQTHADKSSAQCIGVSQANRDHDAMFGVAESLATHLYAFRAERLALGESGFGANAQLSTDASNLAEALHVMQTTQPSKFADLLKLTQEIFPGVEQISVRPKIGAPNNQEIVIWNEPAATGRADLAFTLKESGTGIGQVLAMFYVVLHAEEPLAVLIDEPNSFLHPSASRKVVQILKDFPRHQYIVSTHSPELIRAAEPSALLLLSKDGSSTKIAQLDSTSLSNQSECLVALGARLSDVFGADAVLWVEGATEEACFPLLLQDSHSEDHETLAILAVRNPSDLQHQKKKKLELTLDLYRRLTTHNSLIPRTYGFLFDPEDLSTSEQEDIRKRGKGLIHFLPRRMYENYLLDPHAISALLTTFSSISQTVSPNKVKALIEVNAENALLFASSSHLPAPFSPGWYRDIHGAKLLKIVFEHFSNNLESYDKVRDARNLTVLILKREPTAFAEVSTVLRNICKHR